MHDSKDPGQQREKYKFNQAFDELVLTNVSHIPS